MDDNRKELLEKQLNWIKTRLFYLELIEEKLEEMKTLAEYVRDHDLCPDEISRINSQVKTLEGEIKHLDLQSKAQPEASQPYLM